MINGRGQKLMHYFLVSRMSLQVVRSIHKNSFQTWKNSITQREWWTQIKQSAFTWTLRGILISLNVSLWWKLDFHSTLWGCAAQEIFREWKVFCRRLTLNWMMLPWKWWNSRFLNSPFKSFLHPTSFLNIFMKQTDRKVLFTTVFKHLFWG